MVVLMVNGDMETTMFALPRLKHQYLHTAEENQATSNANNLILWSPSVPAWSSSCHLDRITHTYAHTRTHTHTAAHHGSTTVECPQAT